MSELAELTNQVYELTDQVDKLKAKMDTMNNKLDKLLAQFETQSTDCKKMSDHIDFVETIYEKVKHPFNYIMNAVSTTYEITDGEPEETTD